MGQTNTAAKAKTSAKAAMSAMASVAHFRDGGLVDIGHYAKGGMVNGPGTGTSDSVPAMLSKGEFVMPADSVRKIGAEALMALKDATHTPTGKPATKNGKVALADGTQKLTDIDGVTSGAPPQMNMMRPGATAPNPVEPVQTFPAPETRPGPIQKIPVAPGEMGPQPGPAPKPAGFTTSQFGTSTPLSSAAGAALTAQNQAYVSGAQAMSSAPKPPAVQAVGAPQTPSVPTQQTGAKAPLDAQAGSDRAALSGAMDTIKQGSEYAGRAIADMATLIPRGVVGAYDSAVVRPMRAFGVNAAYLSPSLVPDGVDPSSMTPFTDQARARDGVGGSAAKTAMTNVPNLPTATNESAAETQRLTRQNAATQGVPTANPPAAPAPNDVTRVGNSYSGSNISGDITINGKAPRGGITVMPAMSQAEINRTLTNPDGSRWTQADNDTMRANLAAGRNPYEGTSKYNAMQAQAQLANAAQLNAIAAADKASGRIDIMSPEYEAQRRERMSGGGLQQRPGESRAAYAARIGAMASMSNTEANNRTSLATTGMNNATQLNATQMNNNTTLATAGMTSQDRAADRMQRQPMLDAQLTGEGYKNRSAERLETAYNEYIGAPDAPSRASALSKLRALQGHSAKYATVAGGSRWDEKAGQMVHEPSLIYNQEDGTLGPQQVNQARAAQGALPPGMVKQIGTSGGKPVYVDAKGNQHIAN